ncbi:MAG: copper chaperone PCu(A)C [Steroidobacteraceae bacterium]
MKQRLVFVPTVLLVSFMAWLVCAHASNGDVRIADAWASPTPPGITVGAAYVSFVASATDRLIGASSPIAERVEMHSMTMDGGLMRMRPLQDLALPAGKMVKLSPSGTHFMLIGLKQPLKAGAQFQLQLKFQLAGERSVAVQVRAQPASG